MQQLYFFVASIADRAFSSSYELPPQPPAGIFDVRFASNEMLRVFEHGAEEKSSIRISSARYPVAISWEMRQRTNASIEIGARAIPLTMKGSTYVSSGDDMVKLRVSVDHEIPTKFTLEQAYPNPFNPVTTIRYAIPVESKVSMTVSNVLGQIVDVLVDKIESSGYKSVEWHASNLAGGVYFCRLEAISVVDPENSFHQTRKMILVK